MTPCLVTKSLLVSHRQCPKRAWLEAHGNVAEQHSLSSLAMLEQGQVVHEAGRSLYADAVRIRADLPLMDAALQTTAELSGAGRPIIEAAFVAGALGVRVDVLVPGSRGHRIIEIKSAGTVKDAALDDCAIQYACLVAAGEKIESVVVLHPNTAIARPEGGTGAEVMVSENVTDLVHWRSPSVGAWVDACAKTLAGAVPDVPPGSQCNDPNPCPFAAHCGTPEKLTDPDLVQYLPSKVGAVKDLIAMGVTQISAMPPGAMVNARNALVREAVVQRRALVRADVADLIRELPYPRHFLDFEAASFAIPRFAGMRAYQALVFQWSAHQLDQPGGALTHREFLDVTGGDPRRSFAESLLAAVGADGPVFVYSAYEKTRLKELALELPDLAERLIRLVARLVDVLPLARAGYYAPEMCGSWSLKSIQPTLPPCPDLEAYSAMGDVADGVAAQAAYMEQINPESVGPQKEAQRQQMLRYCKADTRGLAHFVACMESALDPLVINDSGPELAHA